MARAPRRDAREPAAGRQRAPFPSPLFAFLYILQMGALRHPALRIIFRLRMQRTPAPRRGLRPSLYIKRMRAPCRSHALSRLLMQCRPFTLARSSHICRRQHHLSARRSLHVCAGPAAAPPSVGSAPIPLPKVAGDHRAPPKSGVPKPEHCTYSNSIHSSPGSICLQKSGVSPSRVHCV